MKIVQSSFSSIVRINFDLLCATSLGFTAWATWPTNMKWYGFGLLSLCCGLAAIAVFIRAIRTISSLYSRDKAMAEYLAQGSSPKTSTLASPDVLKKAGMR